EPLEVIPGLRIARERTAEIRRDGDAALRKGDVSLHALLELGDTRGRHATFALQPAYPFEVDCRPVTGARSRRELAQIAVGVEALDDAVDPAEAERLFDCLVVRDTSGRLI